MVTYQDKFITTERFEKPDRIVYYSYDNKNLDSMRMLTLYKK